MSENLNNDIFDEEIDDVIVLSDDEGNEMEFEYVDSFEYEGNEYAVLLPVDENDPEIAILKVEETEEPDVVEYVPVESEETLNAVYAIFKEEYKDEFDFEDKHYVVGALIQDDTIVEDGQYIYQSVIEGDDFKVEKIKKEFDYNRIAKAYMEMEE